MVNILIVDDERDIRDLLSDALKDEHYNVFTANNVSSAITALEQNDFHVVILDIWLEGQNMDGIGLLRTIKKQYPSVPVIMISGHANTEIAVQTIKLGAYDFIEKPFKTSRLLILVKRALEMRQLLDVTSSLQQPYLKDPILMGNSKAILEIRDFIRNNSLSNSRILIRGEMGVGKGVFARTIHQHSKRKEGHFIHFVARSKVHNRNLELSEVANSNNALLKANEGTLFIDEISNLDLHTQKSLLGVLRSGKIGNQVFDGRILASTSKDLKKLAEEGLFLEDLFSRLSTTTLLIPPLRERKQDIKPLSEHFFQFLAQELHIKHIEVADSIYSAILAHDWPGNIRQLKNTIERLLILAIRNGSSQIDLSMLEGEMLSVADETYSRLSASMEIVNQNYRDARTDFEKKYLTVQLLRFGGNVSKTAEFIGLDRTALHKKLKFMKLHKYVS